jgi:ketosteroid isomerase-like protein
VNVESESSNNWSKDEEDVMARVETFNKAWEKRDMDFIERYYAHDHDMLLFFERRQLTGWKRVKTLYRNMFSHASQGEVESTHSNAKVKVIGDMAYVASNFRLKVKEHSGRSVVDEGRSTVVFERRKGNWIVVHRHTSFQAPPGPQRHTPIHIEPGPLWSPTIEGVWGNEEGDTFIASGTHMVTSEPEEMRRASKYVIENENIVLTPINDDGSKTNIEIVELGPERLVLKSEGKTTLSVWKRLE